jgi:AcrR family transcriptional regulator
MKVKLTGSIMPISAVSINSTLRRKRIVEASQRMFSETAYSEVQMDDVAKAAGVAKPTLYRYFATKEDLFLEGLDLMLEDLAIQAEASMQSAHSAGEALRAGVRIVLFTLGRCIAAIHAFDGNDASLGDRGRAIIRERVKRIRDTFAQVVSRGTQNGEFREVNPLFASLAILGSVRMTAANIGDSQHAEAARSLADLLHQGLAKDARQTESGSSAIV